MVKFLNDCGKLRPADLVVILGRRIFLRRPSPQDASRRHYPLGLQRGLREATGKVSSISRKAVYFRNYSARSASTGLTRLARRAGNRHASNAAMANMVIVVPSNNGLCAETW